MQCSTLVHNTVWEYSCLRLNHHTWPFIIRFGVTVYLSTRKNYRLCNLVLVEFLVDLVWYSFIQTKQDWPFASQSVFFCHYQESKYVPIPCFVTTLIKFMFSKKTTKNEKIFTGDLTLHSKCQIDGEDFVNFGGLLRKHELYQWYNERISYI